MYNENDRYGLVATEVHGESMPGSKSRLPLGNTVSLETEALIILSDVEEKMINFIKKNVNFSHRGTRMMQIQILNRYKRCHGIENTLEESHVKHAKKWISDKKFICWRLGALFDVAFPKSLIKKLSSEAIQHILSQMESAQKPQGVLLEFTEGNKNILNHIGIIGMTREQAIEFMQKILPEYS